MHPSEPGRNNVTPAMIVIFSGMVSFAAYSVDIFLPGFPRAGEDLHAAPSSVQLTITAFLLGTAVGQLLFGPISDRYGRRAPLIVGAGVCVLASSAAALAPSIELLVAARAIQGLAGAAGLVICKAMLSDSSSRLYVVRHLSTTSAAAGAANILAPVLGGVLAATLGWRAALGFLAAAALVLFIGVIVAVPETHLGYGSVPRRGRPLGARGQHLRNHAFLRFVLVQAGSYGTLIAYVSASPFLYQAALGFDGITFGALFAVNGAALVLANLVANRLLWRTSPQMRVALALLVSIAGTVAFVTVWLAGAPPWLVAACITAAIAPLGVNSPNLTGLALDRVSHSTGSAAALSGFVQFSVGALVAPLVGIVGTPTPLTAGATMLALAVPSFILLVVAAPRRARGMRRDQQVKM